MNKNFKLVHDLKSLEENVDRNGNIREFSKPAQHFDNENDRSRRRYGIEPRFLS